MTDADTDSERGAAEPAPDHDLVSETENLIETYQATAEWIRFADAKAAVVLTVNGALASVLIPELDGVDVGLVETVLQGATVVTFAVWALSAIGSSVAAFRCILPIRRAGKHPALDRCAHFHPAAISARYGMDDTSAFISGFIGLGTAGFRREVLAGLLIDAHVSARKYGHVTFSIQLLAWAAAFGFGFLLLTRLG